MKVAGSQAKKFRKRRREVERAERSLTVIGRNGRPPTSSLVNIPTRLV